MPKRVKVIKESSTGRNLLFKDNFKGHTMSSMEFVCQIQAGNYDNHHVRIINGIPTPVSNPDSTKNNNLG